MTVYKNIEISWKLCTNNRPFLGTFQMENCILAQLTKYLRLTSFLKVSLQFWEKHQRTLKTHKVRKLFLPKNWNNSLKTKLCIGTYIFYSVSHYKGMVLWTLKLSMIDFDPITFQTLYIRKLAGPWSNFGLSNLPLFRKE